MTTAQHTDVSPSPDSPNSPPGGAPRDASPQRRTGTRLWLLVLLVLIAAGVWYFVVYTRTPRVVLITSGDTPYWDPVIAGARDAARQFDVDLVVDRIKSDPYVQAETIKKRLAERNLDGVAISPLNASIQANLLADIAAQTTLVTLDSDAPVTGRLLFVGTDNYDAGRSAGASVKEALPDGGEVIVCLGNPDKENTQHRRQGVIDELLDREEQPNRTPDELDKPIKGERYTIVATLVDESDPAKATQLAADALKANPNVKGFVGLLGYSAPAIVAALEQGGKLGQVKVVGFDVADATQKAIDDGNVYATIMQDQYGCGFHAIRVLADRAKGVKGGLPLFQVHALGHRTIRKDNLADARMNSGQPMTPSVPPIAPAAAAAAEAPSTAPASPAS
jgi:ribose transport system substrate-binding protein